jgi:hypothetical protein
MVRGLKFWWISFATALLLLAGNLVVSQELFDESEDESAEVPTGLEETSSERTGEVTFVEGRARRRPLDANHWLKALEGSEIISGDKVRTLRDSRAELSLRELNIIRLAPSTTIDIVKLYEESREGRDETQIDVERGDIWALVGEVTENTSFDISTPVVGAAITGTQFRISVDDDSSTTLKVYEGEVHVTNLPDREDLIPRKLPQTGPGQIPGPQQIPGPREVTFEVWYYIVKNMQEIRIGKDGQLLSSGSFSLEDDDEQTEWVLWNLDRDQERKKY